MQKLQFPGGFLWGAATSAHQVEGNTHNDWTEWEKENAERLAIEAEKRFGHLPNWSDIRAQAQDLHNYISGRACDHYHRFEEDFDIAKSLGHNAHRFSIEWSRIEPEEGKWDEKEIEHYRQVIRALRARGMEPFVTLWHWTNPLWIRDIGGWENRKTIDYFVRYVERMVTAFPDVRFWVVLNEPNIYATFSYFKGSEPPGVKSAWRALRVYFSLLETHKHSYAAIKRINRLSQVGMAHSIIFFQPKNYILDYFWNHHALKNIKGKNDFIGVNYYTRRFFGKDAYTQRSDLGWDIYPPGMYHSLTSMGKYRAALYVTENGIADVHDAFRGAFIKNHLQEIHKAIQGGIDVRGYFYWSLLDNFEFPEVRGFWPRFGLVEMDYKTLERKVRPSALAYKKIIEANSLDI